MKKRGITKRLGWVCCFERSFVKDLPNPLKTFTYFATMLQNYKKFLKV